MLKLSVCLFASFSIALSALPKAATAQRLSSSQCRNLEMRAVQYIQSNSPMIGTYGYHQFWTDIVPSYLVRLEGMYPECSFWDQRQLTDDDYEALSELSEAQTERLLEVIELMR